MLTLSRVTEGAKRVFGPPYRARAATTLTLTLKPSGRPTSEGGRPAALAALLSEAPQCVPFTLRVEVFRALVAAEKARCDCPCLLSRGQRSAHSPPWRIWPGVVLPSRSMVTFTEAAHTCQGKFGY